ncbi:hypothetical protein [Porphyrobacter sp. HT-58-2]|uniref:hypothetical protein n=1 Tax=Porphyrobacter sp. HT-58-2 TaxID=2023229 RepID=UPI0011B0C3A8|nr:hypothetical protein [Porphyrobacter sp. HT-58-2]
MTELSTILAQLGYGVASNAIYAWVQKLSNGSANTKKAAEDLQNELSLLGVEITAQNVIEALAKHGILKIDQTNIFSSDKIVFGSNGGSASFGNDSSMTTSGTSIKAGIGASIVATGDAQIRQNADGSITFHVGKD